MHRWHQLCWTTNPHYNVRPAGITAFTKQVTKSNPKMQLQLFSLLRQFLNVGGHIAKQCCRTFLHWVKLEKREGKNIMNKKTARAESHWTTVNEIYKPKSRTICTIQCSLARTISLKKGPTLCGDSTLSPPFTHTSLKYTVWLSLSHRVDASWRACSMKPHTSQTPVTPLAWVKQNRAHIIA